MFYVNNKNDDLYGVIDTDDNVDDFFTRDELFNFVEKQNIEIDGVDTSSHTICIVKPVKETVRLFRQGKVHLAVSTMSIENNRVGVRFKSKPTSGEMKFVSNGCINIARRGVNDYSFDLGNSKSYRSGLTLDDILMTIESLFRGWTITEAKEGSY